MHVFSFEKLNFKNTEASVILVKLKILREMFVFYRTAVLL
jgi:hypothetical protein